jgi:hypothetical protein
MAYTLTPSTAAILPSSSANLSSLPLPSWSVSLLGAGDAGRSLQKIRVNNLSCH